ncbi:MAG: ABC transporter substrate-binding protein [Acidimicrobiales bacterium]
MVHRRLVLLAPAFALLVAACSEPADTATTPTGGDTSAPTDTAASTTPDETTPPDTAVGGDTIVEQFAGEPWFLGAVPSEPVAADSSLDPIRIGMINQEETPIGSFPEMRFAAQAAVDFINTELGGVDGHPIELFPCVTQFSAEQSQACAQELVQKDVVALVGGIDVMSQAAIPVLAQNNLPVIGGIPAGLAEQQSDLHFAFSGGTAGAMAAMAAHARENGAEKLTIAYGDFDAFSVAARNYGGAVAESLDMEVQYIPFVITATDFLPVITQAAEFGADAVIVAAADTAQVSR